MRALQARVAQLEAERTQAERAERGRREARMAAAEWIDEYEPKLFAYRTALDTELVNQSTVTLLSERLDALDQLTSARESRAPSALTQAREKELLQCLRHVDDADVARDGVMCAKALRRFTDALELKDN